jgi:23S rRNA (adenine2030-N6)-methyltransferase
MLSYLHGFHAGNFADVHKHTALVLILEHLCRKFKPFGVIDTHAGAGWYDLGSEQAAKTGEWENGIAAVQHKQDFPSSLNSYVDLVSTFDPESVNPGSGLKKRQNSNGKGAGFYPGSPFIVRSILRDQDQLTLMELHPREYETLARNIGNDPRIHLHKRDGYEGLVALMPPTIRRGLVLMDPSYDVKQDYERAAKSMIAAHRKWPTGIFMLWYPILEAGFDRSLRDGFAKIATKGGVLCAELAARDGGAKGRMRGTGLLIVNPPWQLDAQLTEAGNWMADVLTLPGPARHEVRWLVPAV